MGVLPDGADVNLLGDNERRRIFSPVVDHACTAARQYTETGFWFALYTSAGAPIHRAVGDNLGLNVSMSLEVELRRWRP